MLLRGTDGLGVRRVLGGLLVERWCLLRASPGLQGHGAPCRRAVSERRRKSRALPGALCVGLSRATDRLVVVGDPDVIERACGRDVREGCCA